MTVKVIWDDRLSLREDTQRVYDETVRLTAEELKQAERVIEFGCSTGQLLKRLADYPVQIVGIDQRYQALRQAQAALESKGRRVPIVTSGIPEKGDVLMLGNYSQCTWKKVFDIGYSVFPAYLSENAWMLEFWGFGRLVLGPYIRRDGLYVDVGGSTEEAMRRTLEEPDFTGTIMEGKMRLLSRERIDGTEKITRILYSNKDHVYVDKFRLLV